MILALFILILLPVKGFINYPQPPKGINSQPITMSSNKTYIENDRDWWKNIQKAREENENNENYGNWWKNIQKAGEERENQKKIEDNKQSNQPAVNKGNIVTLQEKNQHQEKSVQDSINNNNGQPITASSDKTYIENDRDWWRNIQKAREERENQKKIEDNKQSNQPAGNKGNIVTFHEKNQHQEKSVQDSINNNEKQSIKEKSQVDNKVLVDVEEKSPEGNNNFHPTHISYVTDNNSNQAEELSILSQLFLQINNYYKTIDNKDDIGNAVNNSMSISEQPCYCTVCTHVVLVASSLYFYRTVFMF